LFKIGFDLLNHFTIEVYVAHQRSSLTRLRALLFDLLEGPAPAATPAAAPAAAEAKEG
jgi:hypothetical protein